MRLKNTQRTYRLSTKARSEGAVAPSVNTEGDILSTKLTKRSRLTKAVTLFALSAMGVIASPVAATFAAPENTTDDTPAAAPARSGNDITGNDGGASTATGGIQIDNVRATRQYDKATVGSSVNIHVDYSGKKVAQGATFTVSLGEGLKVPAGMNKIALKATTLDGSHEETIGECTITDNALNCEITADIAATLGGNGDLKAAYVDFSATIDSSAIGKKSVEITVAGTTYTVSMGDGVVGEKYDDKPGKGAYSDGMENGLHRHRGWIWTGELAGGTAVTITDNGADVLASKAYCTANKSWAKKDEILADNNKMSADKHTITFTVPAGDKVNCRVAFKNLTEGLFLHNEATINGVNFVAENTWSAKGGSGGSTDEDAKPVTPEPTPTPDPKPTPDPTPEPSEPPAPTPEPSEPPAPTPEPSTPPVTPDPEPPAPTPDPTPEAPKPDPKPEPTPEPSEPPAPTPAPTPDAPKPDPKPTPEQPTPDPKPTPDTPPVTPDPEPSVPPVSPDPKPSTPPVTPTPDPSEPPATPDPKPSEPTTPVTPDTPSTPDTPPVTPKAPTPSAPVINGGLAKTGADAGLIAGAGVLAVAGGALLVARRRQNKN